MAYTPNSYYSGGLAAINQGRTADATVNAVDAASFRNYLANLASDRTRSQLGNAEIATRSQLGNRELDVRDRLGTEDLGLRRTLGLGQLGNQSADTDVRRSLGFGQIASNDAATKQAAETALKQIEAQLEAVRIQGQQMTDYWRAGGGVNPQVQRAMIENERQQRELLAQAQAAATIANSDLPGAISKLDPPGWNSNENQRNFFATNSPAQTAIVGGILRNAGDNAGAISFDPATRSFIPNPVLFAPAAQPAPQSPRGFAPNPDLDVNRNGINPALLNTGPRRSFPISPQGFNQWRGGQRY